MYVVNRKSSQLFRLASQFGCVSDMSYIAMYYYKTLRYREAVSVLEKTKKMLAKPYLMYEGHVDHNSYSEAVGGQSLSTKMRKALARDIVLGTKICYINELIPEQNNDLSLLYIPPFVLLHMLECFIYKQSNNDSSFYKAYNNLKDLVHHDENNLIPLNLRDISLEILGICQHNAGDLQAAHFSYHQARRQIQFNKIGAANRQRMVDLNLPTFDADTRYSQREKHTVRNGLYYTVTYHDYS